VKHSWRQSCVKHSWRQSCVKHSWRPNTVYIVDPCLQASLILNVNARTVFIASPNSERLKDFVKRSPRPEQVLMRQWSLPELLVAAPYISNAWTADADSVKEVVRRWALLGGNPDHVFAPRGRFGDAVQEALSTLTSLPPEVVDRVYNTPWLVRLQEAGDHARAGPGPSITSTLTYGVESARPFNEPKVGFVSDHMEFIMCRVGRESILNMMRRAGCQCSKRSSGDLAGVFEKLALATLSDDNLVVVVVLLKNLKEVKLEEGPKLSVTRKKKATKVESVTGERDVFGDIDVILFSV
jgi:hypothetical protein